MVESDKSWHQFFHGPSNITLITGKKCFDTHAMAAVKKSRFKVNETELNEQMASEHNRLLTKGSSNKHILKSVSSP